MSGNLSQEIAWLSRAIDTVIHFSIAYSFQILWSLVLLVVGLKVSAWVASQVFKLGEKRGFDITVVRFGSGVVRLVIIAFVGLAVLSNFGISIAPMIALLGAGAFGATFAIQGTLANYGAGLTIIVTRPFKVGDTISVRGVHGVVKDINLPVTILQGESGEIITIPNRQIMGEILVNSFEHKLATAELRVGYEVQPERLLDILRQAIAAVPEASSGRPAEIGIQELSTGGMTISIRYWVPSRDYFSSRFAVNKAALKALEANGIRLAA